MNNEKVSKPQIFITWLATMCLGIALGLLFAALIACPFLLENSELLWGK